MSRQTVKEFIGKLGGTLVTKVTTWFDRQNRFHFFLLGLALVVFGQVMMGRSEPVDSLQSIRQQLNDSIRVDVNNLDNVLVGVGLTILGGLIFAFATRKIEIAAEQHTTLRPVLWQNAQVSSWLGRAIIGLASGILLLFHLATSEPEFYDTLLWLVCVAMLMIAVYRWDRALGTVIKLRVSRFEIIVLAILLIIGLLIGTYQLQEIPNSLMGDEGTFFETARSIASGSYRPSPFDFGVHTYPIFSSFLQAGILRLFGTDLWGWRFASVLPAVLTLIPLYFLGRDLFNRWVGLSASLVMISSPYWLAFARLGYNNAQSILFVALCVWFLNLGLKKSSLFFIFLGGIAAGLGFLTYTAGRLGLVIICIYFVYRFLEAVGKKSRRKFLLLAFVLFLLGWAAIAFPHFVYGQKVDAQTLRHKMMESLFFQANYGREFYLDEELFANRPAIMLDRHEFFYNPRLYGKLLLRGLIRSLLVFQHDELVAEHFIASPLAGPIAVIFHVLGGFVVLWRFWKRNYFLVLIWFTSGIFLLSVISTYPPRHQHLVPILPALALMIGLGVYVVVEQLVSWVAAPTRRESLLRLALFGLISLAIMIAGVAQYFVVVPRIYRPNLENVINWAGLHNSRENTFVYLYEDSVLDEWRPYMFRLELADQRFFSLREDDVLNREVALPSSDSIAIFFEENDAEQVVSFLLKEFDRAKLVTFFDRDQKPIGRAIIRGDFVFSSSVPFFEGMRNVLFSPVMWLVIPLVLISLFVALKPVFWQDVTGSLTQKEEDDVLADVPIQDETFGKQHGLIEFGIFVRFRLGKKNRRYQAKFGFDLRSEASDNERE